MNSHGNHAIKNNLLIFKFAKLGDEKHRGAINSLIDCINKFSLASIITSNISIYSYAAPLPVMFVLIANYEEIIVHHTIGNKIINTSINIELLLAKGHPSYCLSAIQSVA